MAKAFSVVSWNVEHFHGVPARVNCIVAELEKVNPDVIALYEVTGKEVFAQLTSKFPGYTFQITEGPQSQEILVGVRNTISAFITQKLTFKAGTTHMRPGQLLTITMDDETYSLLFLHLASGTKPRGMGLRDEMLHRAVKFRHTLDKALGGKHVANYLFVGDLNTMGMDYPYNKDISAITELKKWDSWASRYYGMCRLSKTHDETWWGGSSSTFPPSNLDHVYSAEHLKFKKDGKANVSVLGWVREPTIPKKDKWIANYSDHSYLYFVVQKV